MSLTRAEWEEMWKSIKRLENLVEFHVRFGRPRIEALREVEKIKQQIQSVIGQME